MTWAAYPFFLVGHLWQILIETFDEVPAFAHYSSVRPKMVMFNVTET